MTTFAGPPVFPQYFVDPLGKPLRSVKITVYERGTDTKPDLYADRDKSTPVGNPFWASSLGNAEFRVDAIGEFEAEVNGVRIPFTVVADPEEPVTIGAGVSEEAMLAFGVATQAELDAGITAEAGEREAADAALASALDAIAGAAAAGDSTLEAAIEAVETALAGKATPAQIDAAIAALSGTYAEMIALAGNPDLLIAGAITRDANDAAISAPVVWPNGTVGTYTATTVSTAFPGAVDSYTITYGSPVTRTYTQAAVTRNASGAVTNRPAITAA